MKKLPVIVGFGGINAAGRTSFHHAYRRMVHDALAEEDKQDVFKGLAKMMGDVDPSDRETILQNTLIRKIEKNIFDTDDIKAHRKTTLESNTNEKSIQFQTQKRQLPNKLPENWQVTDLDDNLVNVTIKGDTDVMTLDSFSAAVTSAAQLPSGFDAAKLYQSRNQPKGLQLTVFGASDALQSLGISWDTLLKHINPDQVSVYAGSAIGQLDDCGGRGLLQALLGGGRITSKQMPLMLSQMPADFINSYMINSCGTTGANIGACATFLYNLRQGVIDIQSGHSRVSIVGGAEAPIVPEVMEGFRAMGALAEDAKLATLDNTKDVDNRRACRPFSDNAGFTMAEGAQFFILMDDELALELGATIYGSVADVFVNADANKKSISSPGIGNYITVAKCVALAQTILGDEDAKKTYAHAHGTGTPQNRVTESHILNEVAKAFNIEKWPVTAVKSYIGHSLGAAGGDQLASALGTWEYGYIPGIKTIDHIAEDVFDSNLEFCMDHKAVGKQGSDMKATVINSKGFGGNNASALILSPQVTNEMLLKKHGQTALNNHHKRNAQVKSTAKAYDEATTNGEFKMIYHFGTDVMQGTDLTIDEKGMSLDKFENQLQFNQKNPYEDFI